MIEKVHYIDDDSTALLIFRMVNSKASFAREVVTATNGQKALEYYEQLAQSGQEEQNLYPRLVILDLDMPVMGGWEFLDVFMKDYYIYFPDTQVFIVSSTINPADKEKASQYPCVLKFISKPITVQLLHELSLVLEAQ
ncbi:response regulator [Telluribacter sp. SYSU D00476]|uniref:response regulator n=1 Tax=Telluribacter sp. SYSU D00476 TaxID=2811430 RepID=UPI001FF46325|nr:response regulator [Telluribacter sp. SYSU D00476]